MPGKGYRKSEFSNKNAKQAIVNIGDSFVFGEGVESEYTISSFLNKKLKDFNNYNFGISGSGPNNHHYFFAKK